MYETSPFPSFVSSTVTMSSVRMPDAEDSSRPAADLSGNEVQGIHLMRRQFFALMVKRFHHFRRSKKGFFAQVSRGGSVVSPNPGGGGGNFL